MASQRTLILVKPDGVHRRLIGQIISRIESKCLSIVAMKMLRVSPELSQQHYREHVEKPFYPQLEEFITAAPVVAMIVQGPDAVAVMRKMIGATNGREADPGTIRGDYGCSRQMNMVHGSDSEESAAREIDIYFNANEICDYSPALSIWSFASDEV